MQRIHTSLFKSCGCEEVFFKQWNEISRSTAVNGAKLVNKSLQRNKTTSCIINRALEEQEQRHPGRTRNHAEKCRKETGSISSNQGHQRRVACKRDKIRARTHSVEVHQLLIASVIQVHHEALSCAS